MFTHKTMAALAVAICIPLVSGAQTGTSYSDKPVSIVVGYSAGGGSDAVARRFAQDLSADLKQTVVIENRPGASGNIAAEYVVRTQDPHKLLFGVGAHVINASLYSKIPYEPIDDFSALGMIAVAPNVLVAHPSLGVKDLKDVIRLAKESPGDLSYSSPGNGTPMHLAMELFASMAGIDLLHIPYDGGAKSVSSTVGGHTKLLTMSLPTVLPFIKSGALVGLGVTGKTRSPLMPELPTVEESAGLPGYEALAWYGMLGPVSMTDEQVGVINESINKSIAKPEMKQWLIDQGFEPIPMTPAQFRQFLIDDMQKWERVIKDAGIKLD